MIQLRRSRTAEAPGDSFIRTLFNEHGNAMLAYATRLTGDRSAAEDIVQEALIRAWKHADSLQNGEGSVRGWLLTVVRNLTTDRIRARNARPLEVAESIMTVPLEPDHAGSVVTNMVTMEALERLSRDHRDVLECVYLQGRTVGETAERLGIPPGTVKSRTYYALRSLRDHFTESGLNMEGIAHEHV
jgi:RNA polymerase sigma-70 factor (ECF subfamily)